MYSLLIVDDEELVRRGISSIIDWESLGFTTVHQAEDGLEALEKMRKHPYDLLLTDIVMPHMGGLELSEMASREFPDTNVVVLTGHEEFEYAKQSINLGVKNYILKPVGAETLYRKMTKICKQLHIEATQKQFIDDMKNQLRESMPALREKFLYSLVCTQRTPPANLPQRFEELGLTIGAGPYMVGVIEADYEKAIGAEQELYFLAVKDIVSKSVGGSYCVFDDNSKQVIVIFDADQVQVSEARFIFNDTLLVIQKAIMATLKINATCGLGASIGQLSNLNQTYQEALLALECRYTLGPNRVYDINDLDYFEKDFYYPHAGIEKLIYSTKFSKPEEIEKAISEMEEDLLGNRNLSASNIKMVCIQIITQLLKELSNLKNTDETVWQEGFKLYSNLGNFQTGQIIFQNLLGFARMISGEFNALQRGSGHQIVENAKQYVDDNYAKQDLSLACAAQHVAVSTGYLSALFKKETGVNFVKYITDVRMQEAMNLLRTTDKKTYEIADETGFASAHYFSISFKKYTGLSPSEFRTSE